MNVKMHGESVSPLFFFFFEEAPLYCSCLMHFQASAPWLAYLTLQVKLNSQTGSWTATSVHISPRLFISLLEKWDGAVPGVELF